MVEEVSLGETSLALPFVKMEEQLLQPHHTTNTRTKKIGKYWVF